MFYEELFRQLNRRRIDYVVVGGVALVMHGIVRVTADLDLTFQNLGRCVDLLAKLGYQPRNTEKTRMTMGRPKGTYGASA